MSALVRRGHAARLGLRCPAVPLLSFPPLSAAQAEAIARAFVAACHVSSHYTIMEPPPADQSWIEMGPS